MRLAIYTDHIYRREDGDVFVDRAFPVFVSRLAPLLDRLVLIGRLDPEPGRSHYRLPDEVEFAPLPFAPTLARPVEAASLMRRSLKPFWRALDDVDCVWLVGSYLLTLSFGLIAAVRGRRVVLGVRQDLPRYVRGRYPSRRWIHAAADVLEAFYRGLSRICPMIVVGPELAENFRGAPRLLAISVSLVEERELVPLRTALERRYDGELRVLSVGRLESEKNPTLLADVLARLREKNPRWRLVVCGEGPMREDLTARLEALGVMEHAELLGYVPIDAGLNDVYRASHVFLHVSFTEGLPQILFEAFAAGLPVVATAVGGVPRAVGDAAILMPPDDAEAAVGALSRIAEDEQLRAKLIERALDMARSHTIESECRRIAEFLRESV